MMTILILSRQPSLATAIQSVLDPGKFQIVTRQDVWEAEPLAARGAIDAIIVDVELTDVRAIRVIEEAKACAPGCPILVYAGAKHPEWEEDAWLAGVSHILTKPVRGELLTVLLKRLPNPHEEKAAAHTARGAHHPPVIEIPARASSEQFRPLNALGEFSSVLAHSLECDALLKQFLLLLRKIIGINRAAVFLRHSPAFAGENGDDRSLRPACAIGIEQGLMDHFTLTLRGGIAGYLHREGRVLRAHSTEAQGDHEISREFQLIGGQVAIPILDRQSLLGVAVLDGKVTGEPYVSEELALIFHMLEEVGMAIRAAWTHDQLRTQADLLSDVIGQMPSACVLVGENFTVLQSNAAARKLFGKAEAERVEFSDLPQDLGSRVFTSLKSGVAVEPYKHQFVTAMGCIYRVTISPLHTHDSPIPNSALILIENITRDENAKRLEIEASNLRLVKSMAEHLAHEIGNSLVPLSTHHQLLKDQFDDEEFRESLEKAMSDSVRRISRLSSQMMFLAREKPDFSKSVKLDDLIVEAFQDAHAFQSVKAAKLNYKSGNEEAWIVSGDAKALKHALSEVMLNALQANPENPNVAVQVMEHKNGGGDPKLDIEVRDMGAGFTAETAKKASEPFFSTRAVGLGLGLTVTRKIIEGHNGKMEISASEKGGTGVVRITLPVGAGP